jgi:hypothetical protein
LNAGRIPWSDIQGVHQGRSPGIVTTTLRQPHLLLLLAASFAMFTGGYVVDQAFRWTDPIAGVTNGLFHVWVLGICASRVYDFLAILL